MELEQLRLKVLWLADYYQHKIEKNRLEVYIDFLKTYEDVDLEYSFKECIKFLDWFPKVNQILFYANYSQKNREHLLTPCMMIKDNNKMCGKKSFLDVSNFNNNKESFFICAECYHEKK